MLHVSQGTRFAPYAVPLRLLARNRDGREVMLRANINATASQSVIIPAKEFGEITELFADPRTELLGTVTLMHAMR